MPPLTGSNIEKREDICFCLAQVAVNQHVRPRPQFLWPFVWCIWLALKGTRVLCRHRYRCQHLTGVSFYSSRLSSSLTRSDQLSRPSSSRSRKRKKRSGRRDPTPSLSSSSPGFEDSDSSCQENQPASKSQRKRRRHLSGSRRHPASNEESVNVNCNPTKTHLAQHAPSRHEAMGPPPLSILGRKRAKSVTMPGSLFPRSPSVDPESSFAPLSSGHVCFAQSLPPPEELEPGPSRHDSVRPASSPPTQSPVKAAIQRFHGDKNADPSILLPISPHSPSSRNRGSGTRPCTNKSPTSLSSKAQGKQRAVDLTDEEDDYLEGNLHVRDKEHELEKAIQQHLENETRRERQATEEPTDFNLQAAEKERARDKERILQLEEEIRLLKEEVRFHCFLLCVLPTDRIAR